MTAPMTDWALADRYDRHEGRLYLSGTQALVKLALLQRELDRRAGIDSAGFISGYRGSPLGGYDSALWSESKRLKTENIVFQPGVNEELAATSVWGSQQANHFKLRPRHDGVFAIWYGKGPGVDRCGDVFKHGNLEGASPHGGVLLLAGDDHGGKSSTLVHQSDQAFIAANIPVLHPHGVRDYLQLGLFGLALSRATGLWTGFKCVTEIVESSGTVEFSFDRVRFVTPEGLLAPQYRLPQPGMNVLAEERVLIEQRLPAALAFARTNPVDEVIVAPRRKRIGLIAVGKALGDVMAALASLGIDSARAQELGIGLYGMRLVWPIEGEGLKAFASGYDELLVVEEKRALVETQAKELLYSLPASLRPDISGKSEPGGAPMLPSAGELTPMIVMRAILSRLEALGIALDGTAVAPLAATMQTALQSSGNASVPMRTPAFCSGCPHNSSTKLPEGSQALAGIGCHTMAIHMPDRPTYKPTQMGGEGANWIGMAPFVETPHIFQNLGDGTYFHSGYLAVRAAIAAGANITYKVLFNDAVAMTGGQPIDGDQSVSGIAQQLKAEGIGRLVVVTDDVGRYSSRRGLPEGVNVHHRRELIALERELAATPGVTGIIYDQTCAAEKRRRRKRGTYPDPAKRFFINPAVCEGCGDCGVQSNCVSLAPEPTPFGVKRRIDQSSCNKDYSCVEGFCPSFVTVVGGSLRKSIQAPAAEAGAAPQDLPEPALKPLDAPYRILVAGIGGTGVVTIGAIIGMAAHLAGKTALLLDLTGLSQKNGSVFSHINLAEPSGALCSARIGPGQADALIGCDLLVAAAPEALAVLASETGVALNTHEVPIAAFQRDRDIDLGGQVAIAALARTSAYADDGYDATRMAERRFGNAMLANMMILGTAWQKGLVPLPHSALRRAIELNGVNVAGNLTAFESGRALALQPETITAPVAGPETLATVVERHATHLTQWQDRKWADRYRAFVARIATVERQAVPNSDQLARAVAHNLGKLMAYKDEYEVARLHSDGAFKALLDQQFTGDYTIRFNLAPPILARRDPETGHLRKREFGPWVRHLFALLARLKGLRGTWADPFGHTAERKMERALIDEYCAMVEGLASNLNAQTLADAVARAGLPDGIRGFGHVKEQAVKTYRGALGRPLAAAA
ncbi:MAG: indolepyruvate ferredoxin oxidoreductase family protein [Novosphingobium sp.]|jgi:indolepyruvate ferredoxin oxidoreductase|uniref:indolepyruvate ferredoxin oxidoreductase family protein n=1 Tax=Novosphingobium sp. TaxID=1874826 RepID=UPI00391DAA55